LTNWWKIWYNKISGPRAVNVGCQIEKKPQSMSIGTFPKGKREEQKKMENSGMGLIGSAPQKPFTFSYFS